ncbi:MAG: RHS repeat-associated core domain-containing protein [Cruoricaptor ignavus]|nr:RHS repeat-associated core domain-containing protein [Cruoricaptor ignavus]
MIKASTKRYNGNIAEIDWATKNDNILRRYGYRYDSLNRLLAGVYQEPRATVPVNNYYNEQLTYDINGNITNLKRNQKPTVGTTAELIDNLNYQYTGNRLTKVNDASQNDNGYPVGGNAITYDNNGNMTNHLDKDIIDIKYNFLNLPSFVTFSDFFVKSTPISTLLQYKTTNYTYRADGVKLQKKQFYFEKNNSVETIDYYLDGFQYQNSVLQFVPTAEGYYDFIKKSYIYNYLDHLGSVRLSYHRENNIVKILQENNYYPFGLKHQGYNNAVSTNNFYNYKYNGKELQETGMYDYGARFYMPDIGRFGTIDQRSQYTHEAYSYVWNNPIFFTDPTGMIGEAFEHCPTCPKTAEFKPYIDDSNEVYVYNPKTNTAGLKVTDIEEVTLTGKAGSSNSGPRSLALMALMVSQADSPAPGPADVVAAGMLIGAGVWWTYNQFTQPSYTTIADPGAGIRNLNAESDAEDTDVNGVKAPQEQKGDGNGKPTRNERMQQKKAKNGNQGNDGDNEYNESAEHTSGARGSTKQKHQNGQARKNRDQGGEKGDRNRRRYK